MLWLRQHLSLKRAQSYAVLPRPEKHELLIKGLVVWQIASQLDPNNNHLRNATTIQVKFVHQFV